MKKLLFTLLIGFATLTYAQSPPQQISYQGVARNISGTVLANTPIGIKFEIHQGSTSGTVVFTETHTNVSTNSFGLFTTYIGSISNLSVINWASGTYFIEVSIDPNTGTFTSLGSQQLMSVPYALYSGSAPAPAVSFTNNILSVGGNTTTITSGTNYTAGNGINITGGVISNTAISVTPTITGTGATTVNGIYPTLTINTPTTQVYSAGNGIDITGGVISNTLTPTQTTITSTGIAVVTPVTGNNFNVNVPAPILNYTTGTNVLSLTQGTTVTTATLNGSGSSTVSIVGSGLASVTPTTGSNFTVNVPSPNYTAATGVLAFGANTIVITPTLVLAGTILSSGVSTNSVNLSSLPGLWSASSTTAIVQTNTLNNVGIGVSSPAAKFKLDVAATAGNSVTIHGFNTGSTDAFAGVYGENNNSGIGVFGQSNGGKGIFGQSNTGAGIYGESVSGDGGKFILSSITTTANAVSAQTNGTGAALFAKSFNANATAAIFEGKIKIADGTQGASKVLTSDATGNASWQTSAAAASPWIQGTGKVTQGNLNDKVGIGTNTPNSLLHVENNTAFDGLNINNNSGNGNAMQVNQLGTGYGLYLNTNNTSGADVLRLSSNGLGYLLHATSTSTNASLALFNSNNPASNGIALEAATNGDSYSGVFTSSKPTNILPAVNVVKDGNGNAFRSFNTNAAVNAYAGEFVGGIITSGKTNTTSGFSLKAYDNTNNELFGVRNDGHVGINATAPAHRLTVVEPNNTNAAIFAANVSSTATSSAHGVQGLTSNTHSLSAGIFGNSSGNGPSIYGLKNATQTGIAGRFEILNSSNSADAIFASSNGAGAAIHGVVSNTVTGIAGLFDGNVIVNGNVTVPAANDYKYASTKTRYLSIPVNSLKSISQSYDVSTQSYVAGADGDAGYALVANGVSSTSIAVGTTPVYLPDGAVVTDVFIRYYDNSTYDATFSLERRSHTSLNAQTMASYTSSGAASTYTSAVIQNMNTIAFGTIDNMNYSYYFKFKTTQVNPNIGLLDIRITYTVLKAD